MSSISLGNSKVCSIDELRDIEMPEETATYMPVSHYDLATNIHEVADSMLVPKGYTFIEGIQGTAREGQRVFGLFNYKNGHEEMGMSVAWRNSYDKSMSAALAIGASVFVCDNLCISGNITVMRRHTKNIKDDMTKEILGALHAGTGNFMEIHQMADRLKLMALSTDDGFRMIGLLTGQKVITPTIANIAYREWENPTHVEFEGRNPWSCYNALTEGLKKASPDKKFERHIGVHNIFKGMIT